MYICVYVFSCMSVYAYMCMCMYTLENVYVCTLYIDILFLYDKLIDEFICEISKNVLLIVPLYSKIYCICIILFSP